MRTKTVLILLLSLAAARELRPAQEGASLKIAVLEGEGAFNDIRRKIARDLVVEVRDQDDRPVAGAEVVFLLPEGGPSGTFPGGSRRFTTATDAEGRAATSGMKPTATEGRFNIKVTASSEGRSGTVVISQSNTLAGGVVTMERRGGGKKKVFVLLGLAGGAAGGILAGTRGGGAGAAGPPPTVLSAGSVSVGGPR